MIIDCHGHYTTEPQKLHDFRKQQVAGIKDPTQKPSAAALKISDDELRSRMITGPPRATEIGAQKADAP